MRSSINWATASMEVHARGGIKKDEGAIGDRDIRLR